MRSAVDHATADVPKAHPGQSAGEVRDALVGTVYESAVDVAVLAEDRLVGLVSIEGLLAAGRETRIAALMDPDPPVVAPGEDQEVAAWVMCRKAEESIDGDPGSALDRRLPGDRAAARDLTGPRIRRRAGS